MAALDKVAWEFVQAECEAKSKYIKRLREIIEVQNIELANLQTRVIDRENECEDIFRDWEFAYEEVQQLKEAAREEARNEHEPAAATVAAPPGDGAVAVGGDSSESSSDSESDERGGSKACHRVPFRARVVP